jgi:hypothetical protein
MLIAITVTGGRETSVGNSELLISAVATNRAQLARQAALLPEHTRL